LIAKGEEEGPEKGKTKIKSHKKDFRKNKESMGTFLVVTNLNKQLTVLS